MRYTITNAITPSIMINSYFCTDKGANAKRQKEGGDSNDGLLLSPHSYLGGC